MTTLLTSSIQSFKQAISRLGHLFTLGCSLMIWWGIYTIAGTLVGAENDAVPEIVTALEQRSGQQSIEHETQQVMIAPCLYQQSRQYSGKHSGVGSVRQRLKQILQPSEQHLCQAKNGRVVKLEDQSKEPV